jgi:hypothetical protein
LNPLILNSRPVKIDILNGGGHIEAWEKISTADVRGLAMGVGHILYSLEKIRWRVGHVGIRSKIATGLEITETV